MRLCLSLAIGVALGVAGAGAEAGEPLPQEARQRAEDAFVVGRLEDLDAILGTGREPVDLEPLAAAWLYWWPAGPPRGEWPEGAAGDLSAARIAWFLKAADARRLERGDPGPYPMPPGTAPDPYPRLTALVLDRLRREAAGVAGLPDEGPLRAVASDPALDWFLKNVARVAFLGPQRSAWPAKEREDEQREVDERRALADRNRLLGLSALFGLVGLGGVLGWLARSSRSALTRS